MAYALDFSKISLAKFKKMIEDGYLIPSQKILLKDIDKHFETFMQIGIENMEELYAVLKSKDKAIKFAKDNSLPKDWTEVLGRHIRSYIPKPRKLSEFKHLNSDTQKALKKLKVVTTEELYSTPKKDISSAGIEKDQVELLVKVADVCRLRYVSPDFAEVLAHSHADTVEKIKKADSKKLYDELIALNQNNEFYKGKFGENDIKFLIADAKVRE